MCLNFSFFSTMIQFSNLESCANLNNIFGLLIHDLQQGRSYENRPVTNCRNVNILSYISHQNETRKYHIVESWEWSFLNGPPGLRMDFFLENYRGNLIGKLRGILGIVLVLQC